MAGQEGNTICVCQDKTCGPRGSAGVMSYLTSHMDAVRKIFNTEVEVKYCPCLGHCERGPNISVNNNVANGVTPENVLDKIVEAKDAPKKTIELDLDKLASEL